MQNKSARITRAENKQGAILSLLVGIIFVCFFCAICLILLTKTSLIVKLFGQNSEFSPPVAVDVGGFLNVSVEVTQTNDNNDFKTPTTVGNFISDYFKIWHGSVVDGGLPHSYSLSQFYENEASHENDKLYILSKIKAFKDNNLKASKVDVTITWLEECVFFGTNDEYLRFSVKENFKAYLNNGIIIETTNITHTFCLKTSGNSRLISEHSTDNPEYNYFLKSENINEKADISDAKVGDIIRFYTSKKDFFDALITIEKNGEFYITTPFYSNYPYNCLVFDNIEVITP